MQGRFIQDCSTSTLQPDVVRLSCWLLQCTRCLQKAHNQHSSEIPCASLALVRCGLYHGSSCSCGNVYTEYLQLQIHRSFLVNCDVPLSLACTRWHTPKETLQQFFLFFIASSLDFLAIISGLAWPSLAPSKLSTSPLTNYYSACHLEAWTQELLQQWSLRTFQLNVFDLSLKPLLSSSCM